MAQYRQLAQPVKYTSQFDPGMEQMSQQILLRSQNKYDTAFGGTADEQAKLNSIFSLDEEAKQQVMNRFEQNKQDILKRYNGDYGAASKDLANLIVKERNNPFYGLNALQQKKVAEYQDQVNRIGAENVLELKAPSMSLSKDGKLASPEDFEYKLYDKSKIQAKGRNWLDPQVQGKQSEWKVDGKNPWLLRSTIGFSQAEADRVLSDENVAKFLETAPEMAEIAKSQGKDPLKYAKDYLYGEIAGKVGTWKVDVMGNPNYKPSTDTPDKSNYWETTSIPRSLQKNTQTDKLPTDPDKYDETQGAFGVKEGWGGIDALVPRNAKALENKKKVATFANKHPELNLSNTPVEKVAEIYNTMQDYYSGEYGSLTQPSFKYKLQQGDELFFKGTKETGKHGDIVLRKFNVYDTDNNKHPMIGKDNIKDFTKLSGYDNSKDALINTSYQGITFTGDMPGAILATTLRPDGSTLELQVSPGTEVEGISSSVWAVAEAIRTDNNSSKLDKLGSKYGIVKENGDSYKIQNSIPTLADHGIDYFKVRNEIQFNGEGYQFVPIIEAYTKDNRKFSNLNLTVDDLADYTLGILEDTNFLQPEK